MVHIHHLMAIYYRRLSLLVDPNAVYLIGNVSWYIQVIKFDSELSRIASKWYNITFINLSSILNSYRDFQTRVVMMKCIVLILVRMYAPTD